VPAIVVSNYTTPQVVSEGPFEHASTLAMIESMFGLTPLTARDKNALNLSQVIGSALRTDDPSTLIPRSAVVPGPATGAAAACSALSTPAMSPDPLPPAATPEFPVSPVIPALLVGTAGLAALAAHNRRIHASAELVVDAVTATELPESPGGAHLGPAVRD
jgi:hypothetical protein